MRGTTLKPLPLSISVQVTEQAAEAKGPMRQVKDAAMVVMQPETLRDSKGSRSATTYRTMKMICL